MREYFAIRNAQVVRQKDDYHEGCSGVLACRTLDVTPIADSVKDLLDEACSWWGLDRSAMVLDACGVIGRVEVSQMETDQNHRPGPALVERWKKGEIELYDALYQFRIVRVREESVTLSDLKELA